MFCVEGLVRTVGYRTGASIKCEKHADFHCSFLFCLHTRGESRQLYIKKMIESNSHFRTSYPGNTNDDKNLNNQARGKELFLYLSRSPNMLKGTKNICLNMEKEK